MIPALLRPAEDHALRSGSSRDRDLRLVEPPQHAGRYLLLALLLAALGVFGVVALHALASESAYRASELAAEVDDLTVRSEELTAEVAQLESPERVRQGAQQLGMVPATDPAYLVADSGGTGPGGPVAAASGDARAGTVDSG